MPRFSPLQGGFTSGEFSPLLYGKVENPRYKEGLALCQNAIPMLQGPVTRRAGTVFVAPTAGTGYTRLVPFRYSNIQDYMLEFGNNYVRFYTNRLQMYTYSFTVTAATAHITAVYQEPTTGLTFEVTTSITAGTTLAATGAGQGMPPASGILNLISGDGDNVITYSAVTFPPLQIVSPYSEADLPDVKYAQDLETLYFVHPKYPPYQLDRNGSEDWTFNPCVFQDGPYLPMNTFPLNRTQPNFAPLFSGFAFSYLMSCLDVVAGATTPITTTAAGQGLIFSSIVANPNNEIRITLTGPTAPLPPNQFNDRSQVLIVGVTGTTGANGAWILSLVNGATNTYDLIGSNFNAAWTGNSGTLFIAPFYQSDVGRLIRFGTQPGGAGTPVTMGYLQITEYVNAANVNAVMVIAFGSGSGSQFVEPFFNFGVYSPPSPGDYIGRVPGDGYPAAVVFHENRLCFGAPGYSKVQVDMSNVGDYLNFAPSPINDALTITDSNACQFALNTHDGNAIISMKSDELGMPITTTGGPWIMRPDILSEAISPTNISAKKVNTTPAANVDAVTCAKATVFLELSTRKIRELTYFYQIGGYRAIDLTEIAEHLPYEGITSELVYQSVPIPTIWCARGDGTLLSITYDRQLDDLRSGWARHYLGGVSDTSGTPPLIVSLGVIPSPPIPANSTIAAIPGDVTEDLWLITKRLINGATVQYVEYMSKVFQDFDEQENAFFVDAGATQNNPLSINSISLADPGVINSTAHGLATGDMVRFYDVIGLLNEGANTINNVLFTVTVIDSNNFSLDGYNSTGYTSYVAGTGRFYKLVTTVSGLTWLEGQTVSILADGFVLPPVIVTGGVATLSYPAGVINIGLSYVTRIQQLVLEGGSADGTSIGKNRRSEQVALMLYQCGAYSIGVDFEPDDMVVPPYREVSAMMDAAAPLYSGIQDRIQLLTNYDLNNQIAIEVTDPTPFTLVAIMPQLTAYDKQ